MKTGSRVTLPAGTDVTEPWVADLARYVNWMPLVHRAVADSATDDGLPAWEVELRAKVGPFARSKRLRMVRTRESRDRGTTCFVFERRERDGAVHSPWVMTVNVVGDDRTCSVQIDLEYGGSLWTAGVLDRVLAAHINEGKNGLVRVVTSPTR